MADYKILRVAYYSWRNSADGGYNREMERQVLEHLADGWVPLGGVSIEVLGGSTSALLQTMWRPQ